MEQMAADVRQGLRRLGVTPLLSVGATLILAVGIGSAVIMADVLDRLLLRAPAHVTDPDRVSRVYVRVADGSYVSRTDYASFEALAASGADLEARATYLTESLSLGRGARARQVETVAHSGGYFAVLGVRPRLGSWPDSAEDAAVISHRIWQQEFGGGQDVIGKPLRLGLDTYSIAAVAPPGFAGIDYKAADVWLPLAPRARAGYGPEWKTQFVFLQVIARVRSGASRERAADPATAAYRVTHTQPWQKQNALVLGDLRPARAPGQLIGTRVETLVAGMSILVLLITCGNVANLLLVRGLYRDREFVIKSALGASRGRLLREVLLEVALLAAAAGGIALVVVITGGTLMRREFLSPLAALAAPLDVRVVLVTVTICTAAAFLLGLAPAFRLTSRDAVSPGPAARVRPSRLIDVFSGVQVALSLPLIIAAALFALSLWNARHQDFGMETDRVAVVTSNLFEVGRPWETHAAHRAMQARVARLRGVESTAMIQSVPMADGRFWMVDVPGRNAPTGPISSDDMPLFNGVDPSFFPLMRMRLTAGRLFTDDENRERARPVAVITESMARSFWPGQPAVGKCFYMDGRDKPCTEVVGVLADARLYPSIRPTRQWASACYLPIDARPRDTSARTLLVRTAGNPAALLETIQRESQAAAPDLPYVAVHLFDDVFRSVVRPWRLGTTVFAIFGILCSAIAAVGLAVVGAYGVARRRREIGIRSALGAQPRQLVTLVLARSTAVMAVGVTMGLALAWAAGRLLSAQLFDIRPFEPRVFAGAAISLLLVGGIAAWLPARRAACIDPAIALRAE
jgi:putative ABC transport system permease protein